MNTRKRFKGLIVISFLLLVVISGISYANNRIDITVRADKPTVEISPMLYGLFFEDINYAADGGIYAEMVQNRSFEYYPVQGWDPLRNKFKPLYAWKKVEKGEGACDISVEDKNPLHKNNPHYLKVRVTQAGDGVGVSNAGYDGISIKRGAGYRFSFYARRDADHDEPFHVKLVSEDGVIYGSAVINGISGEWQKYEVMLASNGTDDAARLEVTTGGSGNVYLDMISLFPLRTYKGRENGLRPDLVQALADMKPAFLRFPGGCIVHGHGLDNTYRWKDTVGDVAHRKPNWNLWGYHQTYGLGFYEYFLLSEDIGAEPLPVLSVGVTCGFRPPFQTASLDEMQPWIDDALDLIEFANGPVSSEWGGLRARMGHPEPFNMKYICLGNEDHDRVVFRVRCKMIVEAIREKYPEMKIIGTSGLGPTIPLYPYMAELDVYASDEHYYRPPTWYISNQYRFDSIDRDKPKVFVGEYASKGNAMLNAVAEAAYLTGVERNSDIVALTCYAPMLANVHHTQWKPANLIWFDKETVVRTPNYHVQKLFNENRGDIYLHNSKEDGAPKNVISGGVGVGCWSTRAEFSDLKLKNDTDEMIHYSLDPGDFGLDWKVIKGTFRIRDHTLLQPDTDKTPAMCVSRRQFNDDNLEISLRARKLAGSEGFLIIFGYEDENNYYWWNVGGFTNSQHVIMKMENGEKEQLVQMNGSVKSNQWYDLKIRLEGDRIRCYLNNDMIHDIRVGSPEIGVSSTYDRDAGEIILKIANPFEQDREARIQLHGVKSIIPEAKLTIIQGDKDDENSIDNPEKLFPVEETISVSPAFDYKIPAMSVQVIRIKVNDKLDM